MPFKGQKYNCLLQIPALPHFIQTRPTAMNGLADWQSTQKNPLIDYSIVYTDTMYHSVFFRIENAF
jgi:hypothetical protein